MELLQKREKKVKNGQMLIRREYPRLLAFDHFFEFGIAESAVRVPAFTFWKW
jgi:hypothetical protein